MPTMSLLPRRAMIGAALALGSISQMAVGQALPTDDPWPDLAAQIFNDRIIADGRAVLAIDAPNRAEDAAVVPISLHTLLQTNDARRIESLTLVIDQNPSPLAAKFILGKHSGMQNLSTRIRVNAYTKIHAVAETTDHQLFGVEHFVKAAGGCSAPVAKQDADSIPPGTMRFRQFTAPPAANSREAQLMIRHPNFSGLQMDQITRLYVPAHFVSSVRIWQGNELLLDIESGISISENPEFRFDYQPNGADEFHAQIADSKGTQFKQSWSAAHA